MKSHRLMGTIKRALAGVLAAGMVVTGIPTCNVKAANEIPEQTQPEQEVNAPGNTGEEISGEEDTEPSGAESDREENMPGDSKPGGAESGGEESLPGDDASGGGTDASDDENDGSGDAETPGDGQETEETYPGTEDGEPESEEEESAEDGTDLNAVYHTQVSGNDISGNDLTLYEEEEDEGKRVVGGYIELPEERDVSVVDESVRIYDYGEEIAPLMSDSLPSQYIPENGTLPLTRDQYPYGSCWAHSAMALAEIDMMRNEGASSDADYSELHLAYFSYNGEVEDELGGLAGDANYCTESFMDQGGNLALAQYVLANWVGAADESTAPYSEAAAALNSGGLSKEIAFTDVAHLQNAFQINLQENPEIAKRMIKKYGGVGTSYYDGTQFYDKDNQSYFCDTVYQTNHAVTIVGWDDSFGADKFSTKPDGDGAWLIRNSWTAGKDVDSRGKNTYFWMSYYDKSLSAGYAFDFEETGNYHHNYQYDGSMYTAAWKYSNIDNIYAANVFTAKAYEGGERLEAVGVTFYKAQTPYSVSVYKNLTDPANPESGTLIEEASVEGTCGCEGFYTIPLASPVSLAKDDTFSVVVKFESPEKDPGIVYLPVEKPIDSWFRCVTAAQEGQSFYKYAKNGAWTDYGKEKNANLRIKAYTIDNDGGTGLPQKIQLEDELQEGIEVGMGDSYQASCTVLPRSASDKTVRWESDQPSIAAVDENGLITGISDGMATITATCAANTSVTASFSVEVYSELRRIQIIGDSKVTAGQTAALRTVRSPSGVADEDIQWSSSDERVLAVDADGVVTGLTPGYADITAGIGEVTDTKQILCEFPDFSYKSATSMEGLTLTWPGGPGAKEYRIYREEGESWKNPDLLAAVTADGSDTYSYLDQTVEGGKKYIYKIDAVVDYIKGDGTEEKIKSTKLYILTMPVYHAITYHLNGGENDSNNPTFYREGYSVYISSPASRTGYAFGGWYLDAGFTQELANQTITSDTTGNVELHARWTPIVYQITYWLNGGTNAADQITSYTIETDTFTLREPTKEGFHFIGWYTDSAFTNQISEIAKGSIGNQTLYARWQSEYLVYSVTFEAKGHGIVTPAILHDVKAGSTIDEPDVVSENGYTFAGWCKDTACTQEWSFESDIVQSNITLYARWLKKSAQADSQFQLQEIEDIYYYTGKAWKPAVSVYDGDIMLKAGRDYTIKYFNNINANADGVWKQGNGQGADFNEKLPYVQITGKGNYTDEVKVNFDIHPAAISDGEGDPAEKVVLKYTDQFLKAAKALKPFGSVKYSKAMRLNRDYTLALTAVNVRDGSGENVPSETMFDNAAVPAGYEGEFTLTVTGIGNYTGSISKSVYVTDKTHLMKNAKITLGKNQKNVEFVEEGVELTPATETSADTFTVKIGSTILVPEEDYQVSYRDDSNKRVGKATLVITGIGDYSGTKTVSFNIKGKAFTAGKITVTGIEDKVYTGKAITQNDAALVYNAGRPDEEALRYGIDYTVSYAKNINKGTATMIFTGSKEAGFSGNIKKNFKILADAIATVNRGDGWDEIEVQYSKTGAKPAAEIVLTNAGGIRLRNGKDYSLSYKNNKAVASAADENAPTITVKGKGNYQGTFYIPFSIIGADLRSKIRNGEITVKTTAVAYRANKPGEYVYRPAVKLMEGKTALRPGADYTITYINNTQTAYQEYIDSLGRPEETAPQAVIGMGSDGTYLISPEPDEDGISVPLTIYRNKLTKANLRVEVAESECVYTGAQVTPEVTVSYKGETGWQILTQNEDYAVSYGDNVKSGKKAGRLTISGLGTLYGGDVTVNFEIYRKNIRY